MSTAPSYAELVSDYVGKLVSNSAVSDYFRAASRGARKELDAEALVKEAERLADVVVARRANYRSEPEPARAMVPYRAPAMVAPAPPVMPEPLPSRFVTVDVPTLPEAWSKHDFGGKIVLVGHGNEEEEITYFKVNDFVVCKGKPQNVLAAMRVLVAGLK